EIEDKPRIPADPDCSRGTAVRSTSLGPSTSAGGNSSYDSLELQGKSTNRSQEGPLICAQYRFPERDLISKRYFTISLRCRYDILNTAQYRKDEYIDRAPCANKERSYLDASLRT
ncbi:hypothetical protein AVEN_136138-1, partial [Araneus ventricosus]